ncbi:MAG: T9SS type A sorting domain-containing protein, partial [Deltaproteobacteria bacterium]
MNYKFVYLIIIMFSTSNIIHSQNFSDYKWLFNGYSYYPSNIMDFTRNGEIDSIKLRTNLGYNNVSICDNEGRLLMYFGGCNIIDSTHNIMENGDSVNFGFAWTVFCADGVGSYPGSQNSLILPDPGNSANDKNKYYLIHKAQDTIHKPYFSITNELRYSIIDMNLNDGKGRVVKKDQVLEQGKDFVTSYTSACKHKNGRDWWIIQLLGDTNLYYKFLLSPEGITLNDIQSLGPNFTDWTGVGQSVFSPDGSKWMMFGDLNGSKLGIGGTLIYDFDRATGILSNLQMVETQDSGSFVGCAISPNSRFAYLSAMWDVYQIDLWADDMQSSLTHIAHVDGFRDPNFLSFFGQAQLAPDCKIYIAPSITYNYMHVIDKPNEKGKDCGLRQHSIFFPNRINNGSIPNFPHFRIEEAEICDPTITSIFGDAVWYRRDMEVWPNPSLGVFNVELPDVGKGKLVVMNIEGQVVYERDVSNIIKDEHIDISGYPAGTYNVEFWPDRNTGSKSGD